MNNGSWGGEIIRTTNEVRTTPNSQVTDIFMKCGNEDNEGFIFIGVDAWGDLADEVAALPVGSMLAFNGRVNTRSYEQNGKKVYVTSLVIQEITDVEVAEEKPKAKPKAKPKGGTTKKTPSNSGTSKRW